MAERHEKLTSEADEVAWRLAASRLWSLLGEREARSGGWQHGLARREEAKSALQEIDANLARLAAERERTAKALHDAELA